MRICHVIHTLDPSVGGPPGVAIRLAAAQAAMGNEVHLLAYHNPVATSRMDETARSVPGYDRLVRHLIPGPFGLERFSARKARQTAREFFGDLDIVHLHGVWDPILRAAAKAAKSKGIPYVIRPAGMLDPWSLRQKSLKKRLAMMLVYRQMLEDAAFLQLLNEDELKLIEPLNLRCPMEIFANGVFLEEIEPLPRPGSFVTSHPQVGDRPFILFLGRLHHKKGLDFLADAFAIVAAQTEQTQLVVAGPDDGARDDFLQRIARANLQKRVHLVGPLYGEKKLEAFADAACFCLPSRQEGFSVAVVEALACGLPVVISQACHFPEVTSAGAGTVVGPDPQSIAAALLNILNNPEKRSQMSSAAKQLVRDHFTWPAIAKAIQAAYQKAT